MKGDTRSTLFLNSVRALWRWRGYSLVQKILATLWFLIVSVLPVRMAIPLIKPALIFASRSRWQIQLLR